MQQRQEQRQQRLEARSTKTLEITLLALRRETMQLQTLRVTLPALRWETEQSRILQWQNLFGQQRQVQQQQCLETRSTKTWRIDLLTLHLGWTQQLQKQHPCPARAQRSAWRA